MFSKENCPLSDFGRVSECLCGNEETSPREGYLFLAGVNGSNLACFANTKPSQADDLPLSRISKQTLRPDVAQSDSVLYSKT